MCLRKTIARHTTYLTKEFHAAQPFLSCHKLVSWPRSYQHFLEPKGSSPCSQEAPTGRYHEPDKPSPHSPITLLYDSFHYYHHPINVYVFQTVSSLQVVNSKHFPIVQHAPPTSPSYNASITTWQIVLHNLLVLLMSQTMYVCHDLFN